MNNFSRDTLRQLRHICGQELRVTINKLQRKSNNVELIGYKKQYYPCEYINEHYLGNAFYGLSTIIKKYSGFKGVVSGIVEHGVYLSSELREVNQFDLPCVFTFGEYRRSHLRTATDRPIFQIGPYIKYAGIENPEKIYELKQNLGKTMLVFPVHTIEHNDTDYHAEAFARYILEIKKEMDINTVLVSLYFNDVPKMAPIYESMGFTVVCSGYRTDRDFLVRQRAYFELADVVVTNSVGTHMGYAIALNKPVCLFVQKISQEYDNQITKESEDADAVALAAIEEIQQVFEGMHSEITPEQKEIVEKYWGLSKFRSPEDMRLILEASQNVLRKARFSNRSNKELYLEYANNHKNMRIYELVMEALQ